MDSEVKMCSVYFRERGSYTAREAWDQRRKEASLAERWGKGDRNSRIYFLLLHIGSLLPIPTCAGSALT